MTVRKVFARWRHRRFHQNKRAWICRWCDLEWREQW